MLNLAILFLFLFISWIILSGILSIKFLLLGALSCFIAVGIYSFIYQDRTTNIVLKTGRMIGYFLWLICEIAKSSLHISLKMWKLEPEISPRVSWIATPLKDDLAITIFANSITLTPGTVTMDTKKGMLYVHALTEDNMEQLNDGEMLKRVSNIMGDK